MDVDVDVVRVRVHATRHANEVRKYGHKDMRMLFALRPPLSQSVGALEDLE